MAIKTIDVDKLADQTGNLYEALAILAKRSRQIASQEKAELDDKLAYFEGFEPELEDPRFAEEQRRITVKYELDPEPTEKAINEMLEDQVYFRDPSENGDQ
ncbi:MAG: DNA-directed RNA polymerase subunit omega [Bacteroidetes bacterium]|jgi:DNA-directed RNA polymerase subunit K/omega|nr:DNA-directed RNA polymerase subunit omega [Bacteroidota bacterium]